MNDFVKKSLRRGGGHGLMPPMTDNNKLPLRIRGAHGAEEMSWASVLQIVAIAAMLVGVAVLAACAAIATTHP